MSKVRLGDVAKEHKETCKGDKSDYPIVGLEHLEPECITLSQWSESTDNTFSKVFRKGHVLFGRRRAYLKKAAVAPFDGICSGDITVIEAIPGRIIPELLPFVIQNDALFDFAVGRSAGSLSPRVKWEHLKNYEFELPASVEEQRKLADVLWSIEQTRKSYNSLLRATDELVKSQFIELFGDVTSGQAKYPISTLGALAQVWTGATPNRLVSDYYNGDIPWVKTGEIERGYITYTEESITEKALSETNCKILPEGSVMIAMYGQGKTRGTAGLLKIPATTNQACAAILPNPNLLPVFTYHYCVSQYNSLRNMGRGAQQANLNLSLVKNFPIVVPPIEAQNRFAAFVEQLDKSKFELEQALSELTLTYKRILAENLG